MIQRDGEGEIALGPSMVPKAIQIPHNKEIMPREEAGSPPSPVTIRAALTDNDNISEGTVPSASTSDTREEQPHNRTEATVLHYRDDSVVTIRGNRQETVLTSRPRNGDTIITDHEALGYLKTQCKLSSRQVRWVDYMSRFDATIVYVKGAEN